LGDWGRKDFLEIFSELWFFQDIYIIYGEGKTSKKLFLFNHPNYLREDVLKILNNLFTRFGIIIFLLISQTILAQIDSTIQRYRDDQKGDIQNRRENILDGNQVRTLFYNNGEVGQWPYQPSGEWPKGTGHSYLDGVAVLIASEITAPGNNQVVHPLQTSYQWMDYDPVTGMKWGFEPLPGYSNEGSLNFAMSNDPTTWPEIWPAALNLPEDWNGHWYGYFGKDVFNADIEAFFVMDDSKDKEWTRNPFNYFPLASDSDRAGLGLRVEVRSFQWADLLSEDIIFWHYDVINLSDFNYPKTYFGFYTDCGVGGIDDKYDDCVWFDKKNDLAYSYDGDGIGNPGNWVTGYCGYAYLETPGNAVNGIDDDEDGLIDERQDDGIDNDGDWVSYSDLNGNGTWDPSENEPLNDDVGMDGIGPDDPFYPGNDEGEGDGIPTDGEPNFDRTDKDESDQIGLTSLQGYVLGMGGTGGGWPKDDESMWLKMSSGAFGSTNQSANLSMVFASGPFPLNQGLRERFSMALIFGENLIDLVYNKLIAQAFYNNNYIYPDSLTNIESELDPIIRDYSLIQNYPNPFNPTTTISYSLPLASLVQLKIFNILGQEIATLVNEEKPSGNYQVEFNASNLSSGIYLYKIQAGSFVESKKMILLK
jgi:hypothetical protein